jgi:RNA polymerase-binding transcription factor
MKKINIEYFREVLIDYHEKISNNSDHIDLNMILPKENFSDLTSCASLETDRDFMLCINERKTKLIKRIKEALDRIENNTYTICRTCGEDISLARLILRPVSTQCINCKTKEETVD